MVAYLLTLSMTSTPSQHRETSASLLATQYEPRFDATPHPPASRRTSLTNCSQRPSVPISHLLAAFCRPRSRTVPRPNPPFHPVIFSYILSVPAIPRIPIPGFLMCRVPFAQGALTTTEPDAHIPREPLHIAHHPSRISIKPWSSDRHAMHACMPP